MPTRGSILLVSIIASDLDSLCPVVVLIYLFLMSSRKATCAPYRRNAEFDDSSVPAPKEPEFKLALWRQTWRRWAGAGIQNMENLPKSITTIPNTEALWIS